MPPETRLPSIVHVLLVEVPAARAHLQRRDLVVELVGLLPAGDCCANDSVRRIAWPRLIWPWIWFVHERRVRVLEVGHVRIGARVEGVDDHLRVDRAGDLDAAALQRRRDRRDLPVAVADVLRSRRGSRAARRRRAASRARARRRAAPGGAARRRGAAWRRASSAGRGQDGLEAGQDRRVDLHAGGQVERASWRGSFGRRRKSSTSARLVPVRVGRAPSSSSGRPKRLIQSVV